MEFTMRLRKVSTRNTRTCNATGSSNQQNSSTSATTASASSSCTTKTKLRATKKRSLTLTNHNNHNAHHRRLRKCVCYPVDRGVLEFPTVWIELRQNKQLCDGTIKCRDSAIFPIHRAILSAVSPYFKALFTNSLNRELPELTDLAIDAAGELFSLILDYAYTGKCLISEENVQNLLQLADRYEVLGVVQQCCHYLLNQMRPHNCLGILRFANHYFCNDLEERGRRYIRYKFKQVLSESHEFLQLTFVELYDILKDDELNVRNEEVVFKAIRDWIEHNINERKRYIYKLMNCVRFGLMSYGYFSEKVLTWQQFNDDVKCRRMLQNVSQFLTDLNLRPGSDADLTHPLARPRVPYEILFAIGGWTAGSPTNFVETYDTRADRWLLSRSTDIVARAYHGLVSLNGLIYMIGGFDGAEHFNTMRCFDPVTHLWSERACMYHARCYVSVVVLDGRIYAMGGYNGRNRMSSVERYDPTTNQWELVAPMQRQRSDASAATLHQKIYVVGGFNGHEVLSSAEMYDPLVNQWTYIHTMTCARSGVSLVAFRDSLYALGGFNGFTRLSNGEKYTPGVSTEWMEVTEMFSPRSNFATVVLDDMIFVIGGFNAECTVLIQQTGRFMAGTTTIAYVECYDVDSNEWYDASPMNLNRSALSACVVDAIPNAREYSFVANNAGGEGHPSSISISSGSTASSSSNMTTTVTAAIPATTMSAEIVPQISHHEC